MMFLVWRCLVIARVRLTVEMSLLRCFARCRFMILGMCTETGRLSVVVLVLTLLMF